MTACPTWPSTLCGCPAGCGCQAPHLDTCSQEEAWRAGLSWEQGLGLFAMAKVKGGRRASVMRPQPHPSTCRGRAL